MGRHHLRAASTVDGNGEGHVGYDRIRAKVLHKKSDAKKLWEGLRSSYETGISGDMPRERLALRHG